MRVCELDYPAGYSYNRKPGFYIEETLKNQLDIMIKNVVNDWDFTIIITGGGEVRVGKSVLAMQIAAYWASEVKRLHNKKLVFNLDDNFIFDGRKLIEKGNELGTKYPNSPLIFDEAGADLAGTKMMSQITQDVLDYFRECGQYNMLNILVMPDFFDLPRGIAITRSIFLLDVDYVADEQGIFQRGYYKFYSRPNKKFLYLKGKRDLNYNAFAYDFRGRFYNFFPIDEAKYRQLKRDALKKRENRRNNIVLDQRDAAFFIAVELGISQSELSRRITDITGRFFSDKTMNDCIKRFSPRD